MKLTYADYRKLESRLEEIVKVNNDLNEKISGYEKKEKDTEEENKKLLLENDPETKTKKAPEIMTRETSYNSDESRAMREFGCTNVKSLAEINTADPKYNDIPKSSKILVRQLKKEIQNARMIAQMFYGDPLDKVGDTEAQDRFGKCQNLLESHYGKHILAPRLKAFGTSISGGGQEYIPTLISSSYIPEVELDRELVGALRQVDMPSSPYELPTAGGFQKARRIAENTTITDASFTTGKITFTASKFGEYYIIPEELNEDSIVGILDLARQELTEAHLRAYESCVINGTKIGTVHIDSDTEAGAADLAEKQFHGLRYYGIQNSVAGGTYDYLNGAIDDAKLRAHRKSLGKFGVNPLDLIWLAGPSAYLQMVGTDNVVTVDKMGPNATILTGMLGSYAGTPIMQSGFMREDLNATGVHDGVTTDRTGLLLLHKSRWYWGVRRPIRMALREAKSADDRYEIASYSRVDFQGHAQSASEIGVSYGLNIPA